MHRIVYPFLVSRCKVYCTMMMMSRSDARTQHTHTLHTLHILPVYIYIYIQSIGKCVRFSRCSDPAASYRTMDPYLSIKKETDRPNSGFSAIIDLLSTPLKELYITGLDFHRSLYREDYRNSHWDGELIRNMMHDPDGTDTHQPDKQFKYFKYNMYQEDPRVIPDDFLKEYLSDEKYENCLSVIETNTKRSDI